MENTSIKEAKKQYFVVTTSPRYTNGVDFMKDAQDLPKGELGARVYITKGNKNTGTHPRVFSADDFSSMSEIGAVRCKAEEVEIEGSSLKVQLEDESELISILESGANFIARCYGGNNTATRFYIQVETGEEAAKVTKQQIKSEFDSLRASVTALPKDELDERIEYLKDFAKIKETDPVMLYFLKNIKKQSEENISRPKTVYVPPKTDKGQKLIPMMIRSVAAGNNVILQGPKSLGKDVLWETIGWLFNCKIFSLQCDPKMTKAEAFGYQTTDNSSKEEITPDSVGEALSGLKSGSFSERAVKAVTAICHSMSPNLKMTLGPASAALISAEKGDGTILLLDEMNLSDPPTLTGMFNAVFDGHTPYYFITGVGNVRINRDALVIGATQNGCGGDYLGTQEQNDSTMSRFTCITMENSVSIEEILRNTGIDVPSTVIMALDSVNQEYRKMVVQGLIKESALNVRGMISAMKLIALGENFVDAVETCVINTTPSEDEWPTMLLVAEKNDPSGKF